jgi:methyltransferase (TIGR00027 family)
VIAASSQTAFTAAAARAAHLIVDQPPWIFADTLALDLLGDQGPELVAYHREHGTHVVLSGARGQVTCRSRYAEDNLAAAVGRGVSQYVLLGAGLDSFAYRSDLAERVRVFEVDHPGSQETKRQRLLAAGIAVPENVKFVPFDFEAESLLDVLTGNGFDRRQPAFVSWLGVTMYLTEPAIGQTLSEIGRLAPGSEIVADYMLPADLRDEEGSAYADQVAPVAAQRGEPWLSFLSPAQMSDLLESGGWTPLRHFRQSDVGDTATWDRVDSLHPVSLSMIAHAVVPASVGGSRSAEASSNTAKSP